jgi:hypothetical protein
MANEITDEQIMAAAYQHLPVWDQDHIRFARAVLALASHTGEAEPAIAAHEQDYPPLPEAPIIGTSRFGSIFRGHSDAAMRAYVDTDRGARKPLTDEQITDAIESHFSETHEWPEGDIEIARVIERAHGIKE